jgi:hypothetical protein
MVVKIRPDIEGMGDNKLEVQRVGPGMDRMDLEDRMSMRDLCIAVVARRQGLHVDCTGVV